MSTRRSNARPASRRAALTFRDVLALARDLPGAEESTSYGTRSLKVKGKLFARRQEDGDTLIVRTTAEDRAHLLATWPREFYLTDHYRDYPWVLARLSVISRARLAEVLTDAWERTAPASLRRARADRSSNAR